MGANHILLNKNTKRSSFLSIRGNSGRATLIAKLISWFDGYVELYTVDPIKIERALKDYERTDLGQIWKSVRTDVTQIVEFPEKSAEVEKRAKRAAQVRRLSMIVGGIAFAGLVSYLFFQNALKGFYGANLIVIIPGAMIALLYGFLMLTLIATRSLKKATKSFYEQHSGELSKQKTHIRDATQQLIDRLSREIYSHDLDPGRFRFELYHSNYKNMTVVGRNRGKFITTVKARAQNRK